MARTPIASTLILAAGTLALAVPGMPALAQAVQPPGVIPSGGPLYADDPYDSTNLIANGHGQHGRIDGDARQARLLQDRIDTYVSQTAAQRDEAIALRDRMMSGEEVVASASRIRAALEQDMKLWRETFDIPREGWRAQQRQWLVELEGSNSAEWVLRRAGWFEARDAWMAQQLAIAEGRTGTAGG